MLRVYHRATKDSSFARLSTIGQPNEVKITENLHSVRTVERCREKSVVGIISFTGMRHNTTPLAKFVIDGCNKADLKWIPMDKIFVLCQSLMNLEVGIMKF
jgi:hypothetical protein